MKIIDINAHKRTITLTKKLAKHYKLPTNKIFVLVPNLIFYFTGLNTKSIGVFIKNDYHETPTFIILSKNINYQFIQINSWPVCLGKIYKPPLTQNKINQIINRFFNSNFSEQNAFLLGGKI